MQTKLDAGLIQDLFHHAKAMIGEENGMDANTLVERSESALRVFECVGNLELKHEFDLFAAINLKADYTRESEMVACGHAVYSAVTEWAALNGIDVNTGERNPITCTVCGQRPAMIKATQCYRCHYGHEYGT